MFTHSSAIPENGIIASPSFLGEKGKLIRYLDERGAAEDQIETVFQILGDIVRE